MHSLNKTLTVHLLSLAETQKPNPETLQLQQDVVNSRVGVAGQQHTEAAGVKDANLKGQKREQGEAQK